jgi:probable RNA-binding protein EIF1AD
VIHRARSAENRQQGTEASPAAHAAAIDCLQHMSGARRKGGYRKSVEDEALGPVAAPSAGERVARVASLRGGNVVELEDAAGASSLALLPNRFRNVVFVKPGDFVVAAAAGDGDGDGGARRVVSRVLRPHHVAELAALGAWPDAFAAAAPRRAAAARGAAGAFVDGDEPLFENTNRRRRDESDESDDGDDSDAS